MKNLIFSLLVLSYIGCGKSLDVDFPARYNFSNVEIVTVEAFSYDGSTYTSISDAEAGTPNTSGMTSSDWIELVDESNLIINDGFDEYPAEYELAGDKIEFRAGGSGYALTVINDGQSLLSRRLGGGPFNDLNPGPFASATCVDAGCDELQAEGWVYASTAGDIGFVLVYDEVYQKQ